MTWIRNHLIPSPGGESGVALAFVLAMTLVIVLITATLVALAMNEYQAAGRAEQSLQAIQIANGAAHRAIYELKRDTVWDDASGATLRVDAAGQWRPLWDGSADLVNRPFPSTASVGRITVELCRYDGATVCPGVANPVVEGCTAATCIWVRATGRVGAASRRVEVLLGQLNLQDDLIQYSNTAINIGAGGGGNGVFTLHGSLYIADCQDPDDGGPEPCIGLRMQGNAAILNDVPFPIPGDPDTAPPFNNRVWVNGTITGQGNSWQIGLDSQPMLGVHSTVPWAPAYDNQIDALDKSPMVPFIDFPDPSKQCDATDPNLCLITRIYHPTSPLPIANAMTAYVCTSSSGCPPGVWQPVNLNDNDRIVPFCASRCNIPGWGNIRTKVVIPDAGSGIDCTTNPGRCNSAGYNDVSGSGNFALVFNGFGALADAPPNSLLNLAVQRSTSTQDIYLHSRQPLRFDGTVYYDGFATILVENRSEWDASRPPVHIRGSVTPVCRVSQGENCTQTFGQPREVAGNPFGNTLAFAVGPACTTPNVFTCDPRSPSLRGGGIYVNGSNLELNLVLLAHGTLKNDDPQSWYGLFIANLLDWDNNPRSTRWRG